MAQNGVFYLLSHVNGGLGPPLRSPWSRGESEKHQFIGIPRYGYIARRSYERTTYKERYTLGKTLTKSQDDLMDTPLHQYQST